jgi:hypothetical protein
MSRTEAPAMRNAEHPAKSRWSRWKRPLTLLFFWR